MKEKSEIRNPRSEGNPKFDIRMTIPVSCFSISDFGFLDSGFLRISDF